MKTTFPAAKNTLDSLNKLQVATMQILDFGRYTIRVDPKTGRGWFRSDISQAQLAGDLEFDGKYYRSTEELPPQVVIALERAGYFSAALYLEFDEI